MLIVPAAVLEVEVDCDCRLVKLELFPAELLAGTETDITF